MNGNNPVTSRLTYNFIGVQGQYDSLLKAHVDKTLHTPFGRDNLDGIMRELGMTEKVDQLSGSWWERQRVKLPISLDGAASATDGAATTMTVQSDSRLTVGAAAPFTQGSATFTLPQKGDVLEFPNGVKGKVMDDPDGSYAFSIAPVKALQRIPLTVAGDEVVNLGNFSAEGSGMPKPKAYRPTEHQWKIFVMKSTMEETDFAGNSTIDLEINGKNYWTFENMQNLTQEHQMEVGVQLLNGEEVDNPVVLSAFPTTPSANGYIPYVKANGRLNLIAANGSIVEADFEQLIIQNDQLNAPKNYCVYGGSEYKLNFAKALRGLSGEANYAMYGQGVNGKNIAVNLQHEVFTYGNYTWHLKDLVEFNHPGLMGAAGRTFSKTGLHIPMPEAGGKTKYISILEYEGQDSKMGFNEKLMSGRNGEKDLEEDIMKYRLKSSKGIKVIGQKLHVIQEPQ